MAQIVEINEKEILVGDDNGKLISVDPYSLDFTPEVGQTVQIYHADDGRVKVVAVSKPNVEPTYPKKTYQVNKTIYILLALFFGGLGIHKFYAGFIGKGVLYLVFSWTFIPGIIAFCTFIKAAITPPDDNGFLYLNGDSAIVN
ncbi:TM2 domain-containing protein [Xylocopilactobacillus apicola]|uniref:TM2 domain-containing protein n=1 Tax=Xylocopilactobacillus apicola TaxID=2932184 RepID=A0AAU9D6X3_9LACO|nr:TM2 domain-containing protein [Xylocopilactobacillus apicola]BDR58121.1 hypothetical protein XA3_05620 [Xylocopilactobacillus apicola]